MGKTLVIKGADFSAVSVDRLEDKVIDFTTAPIKNYNIAEHSGVVKLIAPTSGNPSFYEIDCIGYDRLLITCTGARLLFTNAALPSSSGSSSSGITITSYLANTKADSYYGDYTGTNSAINIPNNAKYLYVRKTMASSEDTTPSTATLKAV